MIWPGCLGRSNKSSGAALISALLTVALATMLATQLIAAQSGAIKNLIGRRDLAQARWLARGAAEWARAILSSDARTSRIDHLGEQWAIKVPPIPVKSGKNQDVIEGELSGEIAELDGRFNINRLAAAGNAVPDQIAVFARLLVLLGSADKEAEKLAQTTADWIDSDSVTVDGADEATFYGASFDNQPMLGVGTLLKVPGFSQALLARLQPFLAVLPKRVPLNLNTASAELLAAELPTFDLAAAQRVVAERVRAPFRDVADFNARYLGAAVNADFGAASQYFLVTTRASYGESLVVLRTLLHRGTGSAWPDILLQQTL
jgi:general secretion pathway protein K